MTAEDAADFAEQMTRDEADWIEREAEEIYERLMTVAKIHEPSRSRMAAETKH